jgi:hypothetical protein
MDFPNASAKHGVRLRWVLLGVLGLALALFGAGCRWFGDGESSHRGVDAPSIVAPDPDKGALLGDDVNDDGVRDDIEELINAKYPNSANGRATMRQAAKAMQMFLRDANNSEATRVNQEAIMRAAECAYYLFGIQARDDFAWLREHMYDTDIRTVAYSQAQSNLGPTFRERSTDPASLCDFNPSTDRD